MQTERRILGLAISIALAFGAAALGAVATTPSIPTWYASLEKPAWTPPNSVFAPTWTLLYLLMAVAAWLVWTKSRGTLRRRALALYAVQLALNAAWSPVFFGAHQIGWGLVVIVLLLLALGATVAAFLRASRPAGLLLVPYLLWTVFATALNLALWRLNG